MNALQLIEKSSFRDPEFWYVEQGIAAPDCDGSASFRTAFHRRDEKWWLPVPRVPPGGLHNKTRKQFQHKRDCANQILKAAMAINSNALAEMEVPESYLDSLPKVYNAFFQSSVIKIHECAMSTAFLIVSSEHVALNLISEWKGNLR